MEFQNTIGDMTPAELRRFVVNLLQSDPGALPKVDHDTRMDLPEQPVADGGVPVWDSGLQRWRSSIDKDPTPSVVSYIRVQGSFTWSAADANFRIYAPLTSLQWKNDPHGYFTNVGSGKLVVGAGTYMTSLGYQHGVAASGFQMHMMLGYDDTSWDAAGACSINNTAATTDAVGYGQSGLNIMQVASGTRSLDVGGWCNIGGTGFAILNVIRLGN